MDSEPYGYTGEWWEGYIDLLHLRARWYNVGTGTFLSRDAVESEPPYVYVRGNPVNRTDASGMKAIKPWDQYYVQELTGQRPFPTIGPGLSTAVDIIGDIGNSTGNIAEKAINRIVANFEGIDVGPNNPCHIESSQPDDMQTYISQPIYPQRNYNRYDALFSGWLDYWKWHANQKGKSYVSSLDPNFVKAIAYGETVMGYGGSNSGYYGVMQMNAGAFQSLATTMEWGSIYIRIDQAHQPTYNIGGGIRWLIYKYEVTGQESWYKAYACYFGTCNVESGKVQKVIGVYENGIDMHSKGHQLF